MDRLVEQLTTDWCLRLSHLNKTSASPLLARADLTTTSGPPRLALVAAVTCAADFRPSLTIYCRSGILTRTTDTQTGEPR